MTNDIMVEFPPRPESQVTIGNWRKNPFSKWSFSHIREILPTADVPVDNANVWPLTRSVGGLEKVTLQHEGQKVSMLDALRSTDTDSLVVMHDGKIRFDFYAPGLTPQTPHILMSVSKSILGLVVGILADRGRLDVDELVTDIVPELRPTAFSGATVRHLLDMRAGIQFDEDYLATTGPFMDYRRATGREPANERQSDLRSFFSRASSGADNGAMHHLSPNADLLGWIVERKSGQRFAELLSELLWKPLGTEVNAYITVDRLGAPRIAGGLCTTAEDLARIGQLIVEDGHRDGRQILPAQWLDDIANGGNPDAWVKGDMAQYLPGIPISYRSQWYSLGGKNPMIFGLGVFGQNIFVDRQNGIVIAKFSSHAAPMDKGRIALTVTLVEGVRNTLM